MMPRERQTGRDALREQQDVGVHAERLGREHPAGATDAALHLVEHQQDAVLVAALAQALEPRDRRDDVAALTEHRLDDHRGDGVRRRLQRQQLVEAASVELGAPALAELQRVGVRRDRDATEQRLVAGAVLAPSRS